MQPQEHREHLLRTTLQVVLALNVLAFAGELAAALASRSVGLSADSIDFLEDAALGLVALSGMRNLGSRRLLGRLAALLLLVPTFATVALAVARLHDGKRPDALTMEVTSAVAFLVNLCCTLALLRVRTGSGHLVRAAFLSARNDLLANVAIAAAGALVAGTGKGWPDLAVGAGVALLNGTAAWEVWEASSGDDDRQQTEAGER